MQLPPPPRSINFLKVCSSGNGKNGFVSILKNRNSAFTLAEVLVTLGIIGVIAALTLPVLIQNYKKQVTVTRLKKFYSTISQSIELSKIENGDMDCWNWNLEAGEFFKKYLAGNLRIIKDCGKTNKSACWNSESSRTLANAVYNGGSISNWSTLILSDGTFVMLGNENNSHLHLLVDINGMQKPNRFGNDIFWFTLAKSSLIEIDIRNKVDHNISRSGIYFYGHGSSREDLKSDCSRNSGAIGLSCGELIMLDGWQIKDDYPF